VSVTGGSAFPSNAWWQTRLAGLAFVNEARGGKLVVVDSEAEIVRCIYRRYAELGSVRLLKEELEAQGITSKCRSQLAL
jgi:hypothetical protein